MLSLEMRPWQKHGSVSCALIKHSSFIVAPSSRCSHRNSKSKLLQSSSNPANLTKRANTFQIQGNRGYLPHKPEVGELFRPSHFGVCAQRGPLGQSLSWNSCSSSYVFMQRQVGSTCTPLAIRLEKGQSQIAGYADGCRISSSP